jgi:hypothetical protein
LLPGENPLNMPLARLSRPPSRGTATQAAVRAAQAQRDSRAYLTHGPVRTLQGPKGEEACPASTLVPT